MAKVTFVLKEPQIDKGNPIDKKTGKVNRIPLPQQKESLIMMLVRHRDYRVKLSTSDRILPEYWDETECRAKQSRKFAAYPEFNAKLNDYESRALSAFRKFETENKRAPSPEELKKALEAEFNRKQIAEVGLVSFIEKFIDESRTRVNDKTGKIFSAGSIINYKHSLKVLKQYQADTRKKVDFDTIDLDFYHDFKDYLTQERKETIIKDGKSVEVTREGMALNTIGKHIKNLKTFLSEATERGLNTNLAFKSKRFKVMREETESIYLNENELNSLAELDLSAQPHLDRSRDLFLVGCWTGLRFSDFTNISPDNIKGDMIEIKTKKTAKPVMIPIHYTIRKIMQKYADKTENSLPQAVANVNLNLNIKEISKLVPELNKKVSTSITKGGVNRIQNFKKWELVTTHTARRSFATNLYKDKLPVYTIMQITGHKTEKSFLKYIKVTPDEHAKILQLHWQEKNQLKVV